MLKGLDPILSPDLLWALAAMGHGDDLALVDGNHPAQAIAKNTVFGRPILLSGIPIERAARAILSLLPLDQYVPDPARRMEVVGDAVTVPPVQQAVQAEIDRAAETPTRLLGIERFAFYDAAKQAFAVVQVSDPRPYGCFLFRKGVIAGDVA
ncbi:RbsD/FucU family protein [Elstera cyanobacteriorum]|uniref:RbsD/FucU family protein n=1 Tax=Elstera cyanobacteriorum TaxID=2022747 RepID=UPI0023521535|nr:RbsD/FucU domain-containing protein [Elstera cyanobacteriorum]MCK6442644.1 fucose-binding protein [Elstera cyanobacteriorum]